MSIALDELTKLLGEAGATRLYNLVVAEYSAHVRKHAEAIKLADPTKAPYADTLLEVVTRVETEHRPLTLSLTDEPESRE